ncbi:MAG: hypothetical protein JWO58_3110 [Chitinophagaceae bacterium]|nr:hypothetical protein [Chitinophagaceae bacterium]
MLRASALFIVLFISLIIGVLCSALIYSAYLYQTQVYTHIIHNKLEANTHSAINFLFSQKGEVANDSLDLFGEEQDSVSIRNMVWGVYDVAVVTAHAGKYKSVKHLMYGYKSDSLSNLSIYLTNQQKPLSISGNTSIKGVAYLPESGVQASYIDEQNYEGTVLVDGLIKKSGYSLPSLDTLMIDKLEKLILNAEHDSLFDLDEKDTLYRSFSEGTFFISAKEAIHIDHKVLSGNIMVHSNTAVYISSNNSLSDIIVAAPAIVVENGFVGNLQLFVKDSLIIGSNCEFKYPSVAGLIKSNFKSKQSFITIGDHTSFQGLVFSYQKVKDVKETLVTTGKGAYIEGQIYVDGFLDLKQNVYGSVYCNRLMLKTNSGIYDNTLLNVTIDHSKLSRYYIGSSLLASKNKKSIIKWLN